MRNSKVHTRTERERLQQMKAHSRHKGLCRVSTGTEREGLWRVLRLAQYSKVHCHHWSSLGCRIPLQLLRKFMPCQTLDLLVEYFINYC